MKHYLKLGIELFLFFSRAYSLIEGGYFNLTLVWVFFVVNVQPLKKIYRAGVWHFFIFLLGKLQYTSVKAMQSWKILTKNCSYSLNNLDNYIQ